MADSAYNGRPHGETGGARSIYLALYFIGAVLSGAGGNYLWMRQVAPDIVAPDRFTGAQARAIEHAVANLDGKVTFHVREHPDRINQYDRRITVLETQQHTILLVLTRIEDKLDVN